MNNRPNRSQTLGVLMALRSKGIEAARMAERLMSACPCCRTPESLRLGATPDHRLIVVYIGDFLGHHALDALGLSVAEAAGGLR